MPIDLISYVAENAERVDTFEEARRQIRDQTLYPSPEPLLKPEFITLTSLEGNRITINPERSARKRSEVKMFQSTVGRRDSGLLEESSVQDESEASLLQIRSWFASLRRMRPDACFHC